MSGAVARPLARRLATLQGPIRRLAANRLGLIAGTILLIVVVVGLLAPIIAPYNPNAPDTVDRFAPPLSEGHLLGTDEFGRDVLSRIMHGARVSLVIAALAATLALILGGSVGLTIGYVGGWADLGVMRAIDAFAAIPTLMIALGILGLFGPRVETVVLALGIGYAPAFARVSRAAAVDIRARSYVEAARVLGATTVRIVREDVVPMVTPVLIVQFTSCLAWAILDEAALGFLGLSVQAPTASWGSMLTSGRTYFYHSPTVALFAGLAVAIVVFGVNLLGDALRDLFDPRAWRSGD